MLAVCSLLAINWTPFVDPCWTTATYNSLYTLHLPAIPTHSIGTSELTATTFSPSGSRKRKRIHSVGEETQQQQQRAHKTLVGEVVGTEEIRASRAAMIAAAPGGVVPVGRGKTIVHRPGAPTGHVVNTATSTCDCIAFHRTGVCIHLRAAHQSTTAMAPEMVDTCELLKHL